MTPDKYGLVYDRFTGTITAVRRKDAHKQPTDLELQEQQRILDEEQRLRVLLNDRSRILRDTLADREWAVMYLGYLVGRINNTETVPFLINNFSSSSSSSSTDELPDLSSLSIKDEPEKQLKKPCLHLKDQLESKEEQLKMLDLRLKDAQIGLPALWPSLHKIIDTLAADITGDPPDDEIAFRVFNEDSQARYFEDTTKDIRCGNWVYFDVETRPPIENAVRHIWGFRGVPTNFVSITTSPRRLWNLRKQVGRSETDRVAVVDLRVLRRLGIPYVRTDDRHFFDRIDYATEHHLIVVGWLPCRSIVGLFPYGDVESLLRKSDIDTETDPVDWTECNKKVSFSLMKKHLTTSCPRCDEAQSLSKV